MVNLITGVIGFSLVATFLGHYAVKLNKLPLWVIILAILAMIAADVIQSVRSDPDRNGGARRSAE